MIINLINLSPYVEQFEEMWYHGFLGYIKKHPEHQVVVNRLKSSEVDITLDFQGNFLTEGHKLSNLSGKKILLFQDNLHRFGDWFWSIEKQYDLIFLAHNNPIVDDQRYFHLLLAYAPGMHFPVKKNKTIDACFVGTRHPAGREFIKDMPNIKIFGNDWGSNIFPVYKAQKRAVYAKTKIMINQHISGDTENMRDWECLAMKTFMLSDLVPKELEGGMVKYSDFDDLNNKVKYYLDNPKEREQIALRGYELVKPFTYEKRAEEMMGVIENAQLG